MPITWGSSPRYCYFECGFSLFLFFYSSTHFSWVCAWAHTCCCCWFHLYRVVTNHSYNHHCIFFFCWLDFLTLGYLKHCNHECVNWDLCFFFFRCFRCMLKSLIPLYVASISPGVPHASDQELIPNTLSVPICKVSTHVSMERWEPY